MALRSLQGGIWGEILKKARLSSFYIEDELFWDDFTRNP